MKTTKPNRTRMQCMRFENTRASICARIGITEADYREIAFELGVEFARTHMAVYVGNPDFLLMEEKYGYWRAFMYFYRMQDVAMLENESIRTREAYVSVKKRHLSSILDNLVNTIDIA